MKIEESKIKEIQKYYLIHNLEETAKFFSIGKSTVKKYAKKRVYLSEDEKKANAVTSVVKRRKKIKEKAINYKGGCCQKCGYNKCVGALEFHHLNPNEKDFSLSSNGYSLSWETIKKELDKCILVCANCHREIHEELRNLSYTI
jgi:hypothetical protein